MTHAWCRDPSRDERVRAAEDGRDRPLPTLGECIDGMFPKSVSTSSAVEQENKGDGMATERVTLEERITLEFSFDHRSNFRPKEWAATFLPGAVCQGISVRVVEDDRILAASKKLIEVDQEAALRGFDTTTFQRLWISTIARVLGLELARPPRSKCDNPGDGSIPSPGILASPALVEAHQQIAALTAERDAAIRERDEVRQSWLRSEESGTRLLAQRNAALDDAGALRKRVAHLEDGNRALKDAADAACDLLDQSNARVAALEAARGGGEQPRGWLTEEESDLIAGITDDDEYTEEGQNIARALLARSTPPEVVLPCSWKTFQGELVCLHREVIAALAAAGVEVKEVGR